jgi:hypothetical protein
LLTITTNMLTIMTKMLTITTNPTSVEMDGTDDHVMTDEIPHTLRLAQLPHLDEFVSRRAEHTLVN